jgi:decaprenylphospho-beta-D-ribofuranose 2-oxidase
MITEKKELLGGWGNYPTVVCDVLRPKNIVEVQEASNKKKIIARGLGRSYADQAINTNAPVAVCTHLNHFLHWNETTGVLTCEAGVSLEDIINVCTPQGWLPMICPGTKYVTVGGAIANDIHGKAHHIQGSFVNCVISFSIALANGSIVTASRTENSDLFWANFGGLGLLGIIVTATLQLQKIETTYFKQKSIRIKNLAHMLEALTVFDKEYHYSVAWIDALAKGKKIGSGVLTLGNSATRDEVPINIKEQPLHLHSSSQLSIPFFLPSFFLNAISVQLLNKIIGFVQNSSKKFVHYEQFFFPLDAIHHWNRGYGKRGFVQYQFVIPENNALENLTKLLTLIAKSKCTPFLNVFKKMGEGQGLLSFPFKGYTLAIDFPVSKQLLSFAPRLNAEVINMGGRVYLGKDALLDEANFKAMYPQYKEWLAIKQRYDPSNVFSSNLSRRLGLDK